MAEDRDDPAFPPSGLGKELPLIELETILNRPPSRRKRLAQIGLIVLAAVVVLGIFRGSIAPGKQTTFLSTPITLTSGLLVLSNVNYGTVTLNGVQQPGQVPMLIGLPAEPSYAFDITLNAPPFLPQSCHARFYGNDSANSDNHCRAIQNTHANSVTIKGATVLPAFEVEVSLTLNDLPPDQQSKVTGALTQALTDRQDMTVPTGSYFATGVDASSKITSQRASAPLRASAIVAPFIPQQDQSSEGCSRFICAAGFETQTASALSGYLWDISVVVAVRWHFHSMSGAVVSDVQFQQASTVTLSLAYDGAGGWSVSPIIPHAGFGSINDQLTSTFCATGEIILGRLTPTGSIGGGPSHDRGAQGCELILDEQHRPGTLSLALWRAAGC